METIFENEDIIAILKPSGLFSIPDRFGKEVSAKQILAEKLGNVFTVHRLDKETSGVMVFAKNEGTHKELSLLFQGREVEKRYVGLVHGSLVPDSGMIDAPIMEHFSKDGTMITHAKGKPSLTEYKVLETFLYYSWVEFQIHTGRTHQIRVHTKHIGHSMAVDTVYGDGKPIFLSSLKKKYNLSSKEEEERPILNRLALHAQRLSFTLKGQLFEFNAPLPKDLRATLQQLKKWNKNSRFLITE